MAGGPGIGRRSARTDMDADGEGRTTSRHIPPSRRKHQGLGGWTVMRSGQKPGGPRFSDRLAARMSVKLQIDVTDVCPYGVHRAEKFARDLR